jgi:predicted nucleic acid-binding protein
MIAVVDTGPLYAAVDADDADHAACAATLGRPELHLIVPALVVAETAWLIGSRMGPDVEARFLRGLSAVEVEAPHPADWERIAELVETYRDFPLGTVDASVVALAERLDASTVITLDERHFRAVPPRHRDALELLP